MVEHPFSTSLPRSLLQVLLGVSNALGRAAAESYPHTVLQTTWEANGKCKLSLMPPWEGFFLYFLTSLALSHHSRAVFLRFNSPTVPVSSTLSSYWLPPAHRPSIRSYLCSRCFSRSQDVLRRSGDHIYPFHYCLSRHKKCIYAQYKADSKVFASK